MAKRRNAELIVILEKASKKIDRFGWDQMDADLKQELTNDWCDILSPFLLAEVELGVRDVFTEAKGKLRSINEFQVRAAIEKRHSEKVASLPKEAPSQDDERDFSPEALARRRALSVELLGQSTRRIPRNEAEAQEQASIEAAGSMA